MQSHSPEIQELIEGPDYSHQLPEHTSSHPDPELAQGEGSSEANSLKSSRLTTLLGILAIFGLVGTAIFGYFYFSNHSTLQSSQAILLNETEPSSIHTPFPNTAKQLETYTNEKYGYKLAFSSPIFPTEVDIVNEEKIQLNGSDFLVIDIEALPKRYTTANEWWNSQDRSVQYHPRHCYETYTTSSIYSLYDETQQIIDFGKNVTVFNNLNYPILESNPEDTTCFEPRKNKIIIVENNEGQLMKITYTWSKASEDILSTFEFLDTDTGSISWKSYANNKFKFDYPSKLGAGLNAALIERVNTEGINFVRVGWYGPEGGEPIDLIIINFEEIATELNDWKSPSHTKSSTLAVSIDSIGGQLAERFEISDQPVGEDIFRVRVNNTNFEITAPHTIYKDQILSTFQFTDN